MMFYDIENISQKKKQSFDEMYTYATFPRKHFIEFYKLPPFSIEIFFSTWLMKYESSPNTIEQSGVLSYVRDCSIVFGRD